jgi:uncharacterized protein (TIGR00369 family)
MKFEPKFAGFAEKVRRSFADQSVMRFIGAELLSVAPGKVDIRLPFRQELTQQDGFLHAGISTAIVDSACGYAALSLMPEDFQVLSVEFKINLLSPAIGEYFLAEGRVLRAGRNLIVVRGDVFALDAGKRKQIVTMLGTMICIKPS